MYKPILLGLALVSTVFAVPAQNADDCPLQAAPKQPCNKVGSYQCLGNDTAVCNVDKFWSVTKCPEGTKCLPNDSECIPLADWDRVNSMVNSKPKPTSTSTPLKAPSPTPAAPKVPCDKHGDWTCWNSNSNSAGSGSEFKDVAQCVYGSWNVIKCASGTTCLDKDFECTPPSLHSIWSASLHATKKPCPTTSAA